MVTLRMKITKIKGILFDLAPVSRRENVGPNLALYNYDQAFSKDNGIYASAESVQRILKEDCPVFGFGATSQELGEDALEFWNDMVPCLRLTSILRHKPIRCIRVLKNSD